MDGETMRTTLRATKALADRQRVRIVMMLRGGELCVCQIVEVLALAPSTVSKHLSLLSAAGLVDSRKDGRWAYYRLPPRAKHAQAWRLLLWLDSALGADAVVQQDAKALKRILTTAPELLCQRQRTRN